jgi:hypothetical protein
VEEKPKPKEGDEEEAPPEDVKKSVYRKEDYQWTKTNRKQQTLPALFVAMKDQCVHEVKPADYFSSSQYEAISKCLDEFGKRIVEKPKEFVYQQVIFSE